MRTIKVYKNYYKDFYLAQTVQVRKKIDFVIELIKRLDRVPGNYLSQIKGVEGLFEIRVEYAGNIYRIFCCNDEGQLVILFNGFQKKTQKTPKEQILRAKAIMKEYFDSKKK